MMPSADTTTTATAAKVNNAQDAEDDSLGWSSTTDCNETTTSTRERYEKEMTSDIARREDRIVKIVRVLVVAAIICSTVAVSLAVWFFATNNEVATYELEFSGYVNDIESLVVWEVRYNMALLQQVSGSTTSTAIMTNQTFPNVTEPHFEITGGFIDGMGGIMMTLTAPLVQVTGRKAWEEYSVGHTDWINASAYLKTTYAMHLDPLHGTIQDHEHDRRKLVGWSRRTQESNEDVPTISTEIWKWNGDKKVVVESTSLEDIYAPLWQSSPADASAVNIDLFSDPTIKQLFIAMNKTRQTVMSPGVPVGNVFDWMFDPEEKHLKAEPHAFIMEPMWSDFDWKNSEPVGFLIALTSFRNLFTRLLPRRTKGIYCVLKDTCDGAMTFRLDGPEATFLGYEDLHQGYDEYEHVLPIELYDSLAEELCVHDLHIYPSDAFVQTYQTNSPAVYTSIVALAFVITSLLLFTYDRLVTRRQERTKKAALRVVSSLFPAQVHDKVLRGHYDDPKIDANVIASFFPATTVMFADISGFTAWASTREPQQVFLLLETIYGAFDEIARQNRIFKVETVGDCYVAVAGCPSPMKDHAVAMVRFARSCQFRMVSLSQQLEITLGPDTADLAFRIGLHSGAVTGGVLRGQNSRFQLFGDTMNMAARMETTGVRDRIQISADTAHLLIAAGKSHWIEKRKDLIDVKGKGQQQTYWIKTTSRFDGSVDSGSAMAEDVAERRKDSEDSAQVQVLIRGISTSKSFSTKIERLIDWNAAVLKQRLIAIQVQRHGTYIIDQKVEKQLRQNIAGIASMYRKNAFHNFEHASHVTMSCMKMLSRVRDDEAAPHTLGDGEYTKDITHDPLTQFAVVYAALIHDVDHSGVSNEQLVKEGARIAGIYENKSVAENHSFNMSWQYLVGGDFPDLVDCICCSIPAELDRFCSILMNTVLATDVFDKGLKADRDARWASVFSTEECNTDSIEKNHLKAQIVLEHLIQASDVAHTMQHWHIYRKWNERLFAEMTDAYKEGRLAKNPSDFWYQGEIGFLDSYVIPLAKKIGDCGVFGVSSDEFLKYAKENRREWELKGREVVEELKLKYSPALQN